MRATERAFAQRAYPSGAAAVVEVREEPFEDYNRRVDAEHAQLVWTHPGVNNWYRNAAGRVVTNSPWRLCEYRNLTAEFDPAEYRILRADGAPA